ncbi:MAG: diaminopimelate decarboxylase [Bacteroidaceae bacterium]
MNNNLFLHNGFNKKQTPFYYYDVKCLIDTLTLMNQKLEPYPNFHVHYALKANANLRILSLINSYISGVDCVSGGEIKTAIEAGFDPSDIVFAGVGKADWEIKYALECGIYCFNVESEEELEVINSLAAQWNLVAKVALRINPDVGAHTNANIVTGLAENKFGISMQHMDAVIDKAFILDHVKFIGLHFHIGSQILEMNDFVALCNRINELQDRLEAHHINIEYINVGGGLGIDYDDPLQHPFPDFESYFSTYNKFLKVHPYQTVHFELGRSIVGQCGDLISRVLYVKKGMNKQFAILDAGMTDLIRPALYHAHHYIENISSELPEELYDVVGPVCESSDVFGKDIRLNWVERGDFIAIESAGAYGESMASCYNCRPLPKSYLSCDFDNE